MSDVQKDQQIAGEEAGSIDAANMGTITTIILPPGASCIAALP